jgi:hypothetical protein
MNTTPKWYRKPIPRSTSIALHLVRTRLPGLRMPPSGFWKFRLSQQCETLIQPRTLLLNSETPSLGRRIFSPVGHLVYGSCACIITPDR